MNGRARQVLGLLDFKKYSRRTQLVITASAVVALSIGVILAWERLGLALSELRVLPAVLVVVTAPLTFLLSAMEYLLLGAAIGSRRSWREAGEISVVGYASNLLPLPGGAIVRISSLVGGSGESARRPTQMTLLLAAIWLGMAVLIGGVGFQLLGSHWLGFALVGGGIGLIVLALFMVRWLKPGPMPRTWALRAIALELAFVLLAVVRTYLAFRVVNTEASLEASMGVAASNSLSSAIGVVPAGLGIREGFAAILAGLAGIAPAAGLLASVVLRLSTMVTATLGSVLMTIRRD